MSDTSSSDTSHDDDRADEGLEAVSDDEDEASEVDRADGDGQEDGGPNNDKAPVVDHSAGQAGQHGQDDAGDSKDHKDGVDHEKSGDGDDDGPSDAPDSYTFTIVDGQVTGVTKTEDDGSVETERISPNEIYTLEGSDVIKTELKRFGQEVTRYQQTADGQWVEISEQWVPSTDAPPNSPVPQIAQSLRYEGSDVDDLVALATTQSARGGRGSDQFVVRKLGHLVVDDFNRSEGDKLVFDMGLGATSLEQLVAFVTALRVDGDSLVIEFGPDISITLMGVVTRGIDISDVLVLS